MKLPNHADPTHQEYPLHPTYFFFLYLPTCNRNLSVLHPSLSHRTQNEQASNYIPILNRVPGIRQPDVKKGHLGCETRERNPSDKNIKHRNTEHLTNPAYHPNPAAIPGVQEIIAKPLYPKQNPCLSSHIDKPSMPKLRELIEDSGDGMDDSDIVD